MGGDTQLGVGLEVSRQGAVRLQPTLPGCLPGAVLIAVWRIENSMGLPANVVEFFSSLHADVPKGKIKDFFVGDFIVITSHAVSNVAIANSG